MKGKKVETSRRKKKGKIKKALLVIAAILLVWFTIDLIVTKVYASRIPHHYASAKEGRELMLSNDAFFDNCSQNDLDYRLNKSGATLEEYKQGSADRVKSFNIFEQYYMEHRIAQMAMLLAKKNYELPPLEEVVYIKADMELESGHSGYTHGTQVYLSDMVVSVNTFLGWLPGSSDYFDTLLWHELFHCLTRSNPEFRAKMYSLIHFTVVPDDYEIPPCVRNQYLSNPDVEHHNSYATFNIDGKDIDCFLVWITTEDYKGASKDSSSNRAVVLVPIDGTDVYYTREQASNFDEVLGTNTGYVTDPEECMADNFKYAMLYGKEGENGKGYPNPEIIQGIIDAVSR